MTIKRPHTGVVESVGVLDYFEIMGDWEAGFDAGAADMNMLLQPHNTNGYSYSTYLEIRARAEDYYTREHFEYKPYISGYCDGADAVALSRRRGNTALLCLR